jgi:hypothetical protein
MKMTRLLKQILLIIMVCRFYFLIYLYILWKKATCLPFASKLSLKASHNKTNYYYENRSN